MALFNIKSYHFDNTVIDDLGFPIVTQKFDETNITQQRKDSTVLIYIKYVNDPAYGVALYPALEGTFNVKAYLWFQGNRLQYCEFNGNDPEQNLDISATTAKKGEERIDTNIKQKALNTGGIFTPIANIPQNVLIEIQRRFTQDQNSSTMSSIIASRKK